VASAARRQIIGVGGAPTIKIGGAHELAAAATRSGAAGSGF